MQFRTFPLTEVLCAALRPPHGRPPPRAGDMPRSPPGWPGGGRRQAPVQPALDGWPNLPPPSPPHPPTGEVGVGSVWRAQTFVHIPPHTHHTVTKSVSADGRDGSLLGDQLGGQERTRGQFPRAGGAGKKLTFLKLLAKKIRKYHFFV